MKKLISCLTVVLLFVSCSRSDDTITNPVVKTDCPEIFGIWVSYSELGDMYNSKAGFKKSFSQAVQNCKDLGINTMFVHVRANADAFYPSALFPYSNQLESDPEYDMLDYMIKTVHAGGLQFHAWINPYRISNTTSDYRELDAESPAYQWLTDKDKSNDSYVVRAEDCMYFNPSVSEVKKLILDGVKEVIEHYDVDGIHFDDYFYLSTDESVDDQQYVDYLTRVKGYPLTLSSWRRANVTELISSAHRIARQKGVLFGVSPAANMSYNTDTMYADIEEWLRIQAVDYIMPQIYFGYEYPDERYTFDAYLKQWKELTKHTSPALYIGLGAYKCGTDSEKEKEWRKHSDIISRQMKQLDGDQSVRGYVLFSYSYLFSKEKHYVNQLKCVEEYLR